MAGLLDQQTPEPATAPPEERGDTPAPALEARQNDTTRPAPAKIQPKQRVKVIKFSHVSKRFTLHHERPRSFQDMVVTLFGLRRASKRGVAMPGPVDEEFWALRDANFSIYSGEAVGIIGENGSGKSTTLKLITRILVPTSGGVSVRGKVSALLELGTGFHPELTGRENIYLNGSLLGIPRREMNKRYEAIVEFAELEEFIDTPIKHYSSGMVMRLGFAVAINVDPDILITDEVLAVGDESFQRKCLDYIATLRRRGVTIIFVSHALDAVRSLCSRAIWLDHGRIIADGPAADVVDRYLTYENERHAHRIRMEQGLADSVEVEPARPAAMTPGVETEDLSDVDVDTPMASEGDVSAPLEGAAPGPVVPGTRWTSGDITISDVDFLGPNGTPTILALTNQPFTIRLHYRAERRLDGPVFGLAIFSENGTQVNGPNTKFGGLEIPYIEGEGYVDFHVEKLPLLAGTYDVTVAVTGPDMADIYDHQHRAYTFTVQPTPGLSEKWGLFYMPAEWHFTPEGDPKPESQAP